MRCPALQGFQQIPYHHLPRMAFWRGCHSSLTPSSRASINSSEVCMRPHSRDASRASAEKAKEVMDGADGAEGAVLDMVFSCEHGLAVQDGCRSPWPNIALPCSNPSRLGSPYARTTILYASFRPPGAGNRMRRKPVPQLEASQNGQRLAQGRYKRGARRHRFGACAKHHPGPCRRRASGFFARAINSEKVQQW